MSDYVKGLYIIAILISYVLYPILLIDFINIIRGKLDKKYTLQLLNLLVVPIVIFVMSCFSNEPEVFIKLIESITPYMLVAYLITYTVVFIRFIVNKFKNK